MSIDFGAELYERAYRFQNVPQRGRGGDLPAPQNAEGIHRPGKAKQNLSISSRRRAAAQNRWTTYLLHGPPGLGKTTLSGIIAQEMGVNIRITSGPAIEKPGDLAALLTNLNENDILFVDEIHRLNRAVEEILYPAMEDFAIDIIIGKGPSANSIRLDLPNSPSSAPPPGPVRFRPLRDRFGVMLRLELYSPEELQRDRHPQCQDFGGPHRSPTAVGDRPPPRGTPRIANRLLRRVRTLPRSGPGSSPRRWPTRPSRPWRWMPLGLDKVDRRMLRAIIEHYGGGPVGAGHLGRHHRRGGRYPGGRVRAVPHADWLPHPHPRGRCVTRKAYEHLHMAFTGQEQLEL